MKGSVSFNSTLWLRLYFGSLRLFSSRQRSGQGLMKEWPGWELSWPLPQPQTCCKVGTPGTGRGASPEHPWAPSPFPASLPTHFDNGLDMPTGILGCDGHGNQAGLVLFCVTARSRSGAWVLSCLGGTFPSGNCTFPAPTNALLSWVVSNSICLLTEMAEGVRRCPPGFHVTPDLGQRRWL